MKYPPADEPDLPLRFRKPRLARERNLPGYPRPVPQGELAKAVPLHGEPVIAGRIPIATEGIRDLAPRGINS